MAFTGRISKWKCKIKRLVVLLSHSNSAIVDQMLCVSCLFFFFHLWQNLLNGFFFFFLLLEQVRKQMTKAEQEPICYMLLSHHVSWLWWSTCIFAHCSSLNNVPDPQAPEDHFFYLFFWVLFLWGFLFFSLSPSSLVHSIIKCVNLGEDFCLLSSIHMTLLLRSFVC